MEKKRYMFLKNPDGEEILMGEADAENIKTAFEAAACWIEADMQSDPEIDPSEYQIIYLSMTEEEVLNLPEYN